MAVLDQKRKRIHRSGQSGKACSIVLPIAWLMLIGADLLEESELILTLEDDRIVLTVPPPLTAEERDMRRRRKEKMTILVTPSGRKKWVEGPLEDSPEDWPQKVR